jgi:hypothetical protein
MLLARRLSPAECFHPLRNANLTEQLPACTPTPGTLLPCGRTFLLPHRRCRFLKPAASSGCPLLLFDPFAAGSQLLSVGSLVRCISLAGNRKAAVQQLMSQGLLHAQRMAAAGAFAALPLKQKMQPAEGQQDQKTCNMDVQQQQQLEGMQETDCSIDL